MKPQNKSLSFTTPIFISFAGIIFCFVLIAALVTVIQRNDIINAGDAANLLI